MESLPAKTCTQCGELKLLTEYHKRAASKDGLAADCKICNNAARAKYRAANYEAELAYNLKYYQDNKERELLRKKKWTADNPEYTTAYSKEYREKNKEAQAAYKREYQKNNPHIYSEAKRRRRARKLNNGVEVYTELQVLETYGTDCHICGGPVDLTAPRGIGRGDNWENGLHIDHVLAIANGGPDTLENVRPSHGQCNLSKGVRLI